MLSIKQPLVPKKSCVFCKHFIPDTSGTLPSDVTGQCKKYYVFTDRKGIEYHEYAIKVRDQKNKCGPSGLFYEQLYWIDIDWD